MTTSAALRQRLHTLERRHQAEKGPPRPWFGFDFTDGGPGEDDGYVESRTLEEALAEGAPVFTFTFPDSHTHEYNELQGHEHG